MMATGDALDFRGRLRAALPAAWFPVTGTTDAVGATPFLDAVLSGLASAWASLYSSLQFVAAQARIATASGVWLDLLATDYFGLNLQRFTSETDAAYRARIKATLFQPQGTRAALVANLVALTGRTPAIFEPANPTDTGGYGYQGMTQGTGLGYGVAGGYGSLMLPFQAFVTAYRPTGGGVANVAGYYLGTGWAGGGYGVGAIEYASLDMVRGSVTDTDILNTINTTRPVATIVWARFSGLSAFILGITPLDSAPLG